MGDSNSIPFMLTKLIQLTDQIAKAAKDACGNCKHDTTELASITEKLAALLRKAARTGPRLYERPARVIILDTEKVLRFALWFILKFKANPLVKLLIRFADYVTASERSDSQFLNSILDFEHTLLAFESQLESNVLYKLGGQAAFQMEFSQFESSIGNFLWLLRVSASANDWDGEDLGPPPIAAHQPEPLLFFIWKQIASLYKGSADERSGAAASLVSLISDENQYGKMIVEEGGADPLLKLVERGNLEGRMTAARAIGLLGRDSDCVDQLLTAGLCTVFEKILKEGPMIVQAWVAWAVSEFAGNHPKCQDAFSQSNIMRLLVAHLAFETDHDHGKHAVVMNKATSVRALVNAVANSKEKEKERALGLGLDDDQEPDQLYAKYRELEDPSAKTSMKATTARALTQLAKGNPLICRSISESRALLCFVALLEKGAYWVRYNSAWALMEITTVAEKDADMRRSVFKPNSPPCKAVIDQLLRVIEKEENSQLLVPCIRAVGNLAATWTAGTRMSSSLVKFLDDREDEVSREAIIALTKLACPGNYLCIDHSKAILGAGGARHLTQIARLGKHHYDQLAALRLLCYISQHVHVQDGCELPGVDHVLSVLEWASKQAFIKQDRTLASLLDEVKSKLERYQPSSRTGSGR